MSKSDKSILTSLEKVVRIDMCDLEKVVGIDMCDYRDKW